MVPILLLIGGIGLCLLVRLSQEVDKVSRRPLVTKQASVSADSQAPAVPTEAAAPHEEPAIFGRWSPFPSDAREVEGAQAVRRIR